MRWVPSDAARRSGVTPGRARGCGGRAVRMIPDVTTSTVAGMVGGGLPADPWAAAALGSRALGSQDQSDFVWGHLSVHGARRTTSSRRP